MQNEFNSLIENLNKLEGAEVLGSEIDPNTWIHFICSSALTLATIIKQIDDIDNEKFCKLLILAHPSDSKKHSYQIVFNKNKKKYVTMIAKRIKNLADNGLKNAEFQELGLPDLTLVTLRQMANELKSRENLCFAMVWMEDNDKENISIEGSGNPTQLVGLLSRGLYMTIDWSNKNIKFKDNEEE